MKKNIDLYIMPGLTWHLMQELTVNTAVMYGLHSQTALGMMGRKIQGFIITQVINFCA